MICKKFKWINNIEVKLNNKKNYTWSDIFIRGDPMIFIDVFKVKNSKLFSKFIVTNLIEFLSNEIFFWLTKLKL